MFAVFDLDGTLSDCTHRQHLLAREPRAWDEFYHACVDDAPVLPMIRALNLFVQSGARVEIWRQEGVLCAQVADGNF